MTGMILYLIYNFEEMLKQMEQDIDIIRKKIIPESPSLLPTINERRESNDNDDYYTPTHNLASLNNTATADQSQ